MNRCSGWIAPPCSSAIPAPAPTAPARPSMPIEKEIRRIAEEGPTQKELDEAKSYLKGSQMLALDTSSKLASGAAAVPARQAADRLYREAQRHRRRRDARRRQKGRPAAVGPGPAHRHRRPRPAGRRPARRGAAEGELTAPSVMAGLRGPRSSPVPAIHVFKMVRRGCPGHRREDALRAIARA